MARKADTLVNRPDTALDFPPVNTPADQIARLHLLKEILIGFNQGDTIEAVFAKTLQRICEFTGWEAGRGTLYDPDNALLQPLTVEWPAGNSGGFPLPGTQPTVLIPIPVAEVMCASLEFATSMGATPSGEFMDLLGEIATQLGKFIERQQAHDQLREREEHLSQLVESVKDFAFYTLDLNGHITSWNKGAEKIKGYSRNEIIGKHFSIFYTPEDIAANKPALVLESALQEGGFNSESWRVRKDGTRFWANVIVFPIYNSAGILQGYSKLTRDLTKRKLMEEELIASQLRHEKETSELRRRLMEGREAERLGMAQELHDGPIQELYGLIFGLDAIQGKIRSQAALEQIKDMKRELQKVVSTLRGMIGDLRPPTLAPFGLEKAIRSHMQSFRDAHGEIQIEMELDVDRRTLPEDVRLALYRVYQSSMVNIVRHADASQVKVKFKLDDDQVRLEIEDNGKGFMVPERWIKLARAGHLGLVGARERVEAVGGRFIVESMPGEGTQVKVYIPREAIDVETQDGSGR